MEKKNRQKLNEFRSFLPSKHQVSSQQSPGIDGTSVTGLPSWGYFVVSDEGSDLHPCMVYVYYGMIFIYRRPICLSYLHLRIKTNQPNVISVNMPHNISVLANMGGCTGGDDSDFYYLRLLSIQLTQFATQVFDVCLSLLSP